MAALNTVADYIAQARILLQDTGTPARYSDELLVTALNLSLADAKRLRPDLFLNVPLPTYTTDQTNTQVTAVDELYRSAHLNYIVGHAQLIDDESITDQRSASFLLIFRSRLMSLEA